MKAITLRHPWAFCVAHLGKPVENRDWTDAYAERIGLPETLGETIAIHGGAPVRPGRSEAWEQHCLEVAYIGKRILPNDPAAVDHLQAWNARMGRRPTYEDLVTPGIVAVTTLTHVTRASRSPWAVKGQLHLLLSGTVALPESVPCRGALGLWEVPAEVEAQVLAQVHRMPVGATQVMTGEEWLR
ncbi:hypothetical protein [Deinococcus sp. DB0503]|uniref:hypothetical protein n=1 Tax=Deinococcus sp. DB0503 TaxID=2479203 RepID=UPI0018DF8DC9|nr:hypothetical protein [Deinococcus sp. DB0503]